MTAEERANAVVNEWMQSDGISRTLREMIADAIKESRQPEQSLPFVHRLMDCVQYGCGHRGCNIIDQNRIQPGVWRVEIYNYPQGNVSFAVHEGEAVGKTRDEFAAFLLARFNTAAENA